MHPGKGQQRTALAGSAASDAALGGIGITGTERASASVLSAQGWPLTAECPRVACPQGAAGLCAAYGLSSALHEDSDGSAAGAVAACVVASGDAWSVCERVVTHTAWW